jgi:hypothetical protein
MGEWNRPLQAPDKSKEIEGAESKAKTPRGRKKTSPDRFVFLIRDDRTGTGPRQLSKAPQGGDTLPKKISLAASEHALRDCIRWSALFGNRASSGENRIFSVPGDVCTIEQASHEQRQETGEPYPIARPVDDKFPDPREERQAEPHAQQVGRSRAQAAAFDAPKQSQPKQRIGQPCPE